MNFKKMLSMLLAAALVVSLAACSSQEAEQGTDTQADVSASESQEESIYNEPGALPIAKEVIELSLFQEISPNVIIEDNKWFEWMEELTNIRFNVQAVPIVDSVEKLNLIMNAQVDVPDVINGGMSMASQAVYSEQGLLVNYRDYWDRLDNLPEIEKDYAENLALISDEEGGLYSSIFFSNGYHASYSQKLFINQEWLDNLSLPMPTTTDELYDTLVAFKEQDANANGDTTDEIPLAAAATGWRNEVAGFLMAPFAVSGAPSTHYVYEDKEAGEIKCGIYNDGFLEGIEYIAKLYNEGLIDRESFTQPDTAYTAMAKGDVNVGGSFVAAAVNKFNYATDDYPTGVYAGVLPLDGPDGVSRTHHFVNRFVPRWQVTTACTEEYREAAIRFGDFLLTSAYDEDPERAKIALQFGWHPEGVVIYDESDGKESVSGGVALFEVLIPVGEPTNLNIQNARPLFNPIDNNNIKVSTNPGGYNEEVLLWETTDMYIETADEHIISTLPIIVSADNSYEYAELSTQLKSYLDQHIASFITGTRDLSEWDDFLEELSDIGMDRYLEISNESYVTD